MPRTLCPISKHQLQLRKQRIQRLAWTDHVRFAEIADVRRAVAGTVCEYVAKATTGLERRSAECDSDVVYQEWPVCDTEAVIEADVVSDAVLKEHILQRLCAMKPEIVDVEDRLDSLSKFHIDAGVVNEDTGIYKVRLALGFAAAQTRQDAVWLH